MELIFTAQKAFFDKKRVIAEDLSHSKGEKRWFCIGKAGEGIITVRFTYRKDVIRIIGAGFWRKGKKLYDQTNQIQR